MTTHQVLSLAKQYEEEFTRLRRHFHQHPELSFEEHETSKKVAELLKEWGYQVKTGYSGTGIVAQLKKGSGTKRLGIRADMDALPIDEQNDFEYVSQNPGVMHACGHDGHTTMLLCAAKLLAKDVDFSGTLNLIFQPAEEFGGADSGAAKMVKEGLFKDYPCDALFGTHNWPDLPQGKIGICVGGAMASADQVKIRMIGKGGHAAMPHLAKDPMVAAASFIMSVQSIVARNINPLRTAVATVSVIHGGEAQNIIPNEVNLVMSVRALDEESRDILQERIETLAKEQAASYGVRAEVDYERSVPVLINNAEETNFAQQVAAELLGEDNAPVIEPITASEDFSFMLQQVPGCFVFIGNGEDSPAASCSQSLHNPGYNFNDKNIPLGAAYWALLAQKFLV